MMIKELLKNPHTYLQVAIAAVVGVMAYTFFSHEGEKNPPVVVTLLPKEAKPPVKEAPQDQIVSESQQGLETVPHAPKAQEVGHGREKPPHDTPEMPGPAPTSVPPTLPHEMSEPATPSTQPLMPSPARALTPPHDSGVPHVSSASGGGVETTRQDTSAGEVTPPVSQGPSHGSASQSIAGASPAVTQGAPVTPAGGDGQERSVVALPPVPPPPPPPGEIALLVLDLGKQESLLEAALNLPKQIAFAFYTGLDTQAPHAKLREAGYETFLMIPMEPLDYPQSDPGFAPLLTGLPAQENVQRLQAHFKGHLPMVGVVPFLGSRFMFSEKDFLPVLEELGRHHLLFVDVKSSPQSVVKSLKKKVKVPLLSASFCLDQVCGDEAGWQGQQEILASLAKTNGPILAFVHGSPLALDRVRALSENLAHLNLKLVPVSSLAALKNEKKEASQ
ncbi:MAG: divergent polysaccharide deacetylase family protein [Alphaproteobacteria bacterium]|jgi:polysaccharide deacetylase 2 family uncharacterized protein YibQ|nr:divergent polysaccharide deacetylase family protein [Alphaproteobacteria bacterium]